MNRNDEQLRSAFRGYAAGISATYPAQSASSIWLRAERRKRQLAVARAERPLRIMQVLGVVCAAIAAVWALLSYQPPRQIIAMGTTGLLLTGACGLLVIAGCSTMILAARRPLS